MFELAMNTIMAKPIRASSAPSTPKRRESGGADDRSNPETGHEETEAVGPLVQHVARDEGDDDPEVHHEEARHQHIGEDEHDEGCSPRVAEPMEDLLAQAVARARPRLALVVDGEEGGDD